MRRQRPTLRVASLERKVGLLALGHRRDVLMVHRRSGRRLLIACPQAILEVGHHPRAVSVAVAPSAVRAKVDRLHRPLAVAVTVRLRVAVASHARARMSEWSGVWQARSSEHRERGVERMATG